MATLLFGSPEPTMVGFRNLVGVGIGPVSKKMAVKSMGKILAVSNFNFK